jgi:hypothetical protein
VRRRAGGPSFYFGFGDRLAYLTLMASVAESQVDAFRQDPALDLHSRMVAWASHLLSYCVTLQPLGQLLNDAVDGGGLLHADLWHPLRAPMFHRPMKVRTLAAQIDVAWASARAEIPQDDGGWLVGEVGRLSRLFHHAATAGDCVVTALNPPSDEERARRVRIPFLWKHDG